jgi:uncharacterized phage protein (TIGR01671 family)
MREIKFRAWNKEHGEMCYSMKTTLFEKREFYPFGIEVGFSHYPQEGWELMQYTGLKDKNGKEIYEGDIVRDSTMTYLGIIAWNTGDCSFDVKSTKTGMHYGIGISRQNDLEIVGNIYENPELLEDKPDE